MYSVLSERTISAFPVSIGTSLALESIDTGPLNPYDPERVIPNTVDTRNYTEFWVNLFTLFRNIYQSVPSASQESLEPLEIAEVMLQEIDIIKEFISGHTANSLACVFYASDYSGLKQKHPHASLRIDKTAKQILYTETLKKAIGHVFKQFDKKDETIKHFSLSIEPKPTAKALVLTHYAYDLLSYKNFRTLDLLESHTGILKPRALWYTKLSNGRDLIRIPFNSMSMQVFGDSQTFYAMNSKVRQQVLDLSQKYQWDAFTTADRVKYGLKNMSDAFAGSILSTML